MLPDYDMIYGINLTNTCDYFELHYGPKIWFIFLKKHVEKSAILVILWGKLRLILNSIIKYNINSITGEKNNTKNLFSFSANHNLKNAPELILDAPELILQQ